MKIENADFVLTRSQILKLAELANHFKDTKFFNLYETNESGIGPSMHVRFNLFEEDDAKLNITDVSTW
jgi:hypothetical protein